MQNGIPQFSSMLMERNARYLMVPEVGESRNFDDLGAFV
jgi:hypothetical protein